MDSVENNIATLIKRVARGKHGSEHITQEEACYIFSELLQPHADMLQLGAFLIAERMKGETSSELAGFVQAAHAHTPNYQAIEGIAHAVDLPCYAGKRRAAHAYLSAALQAKASGIPIFVHGVAHINHRITAWQVLEKQGVKRAKSLLEAHHIMQNEHIVYMDLSDISPNLYRMYELRERLGVRSFANTVARLLNPMQCEGQLNGFFHTPYANYMAEANMHLGQHRSLIFMGAEGEPELYADRQKIVKMQINQTISDIQFEDCGHNPYPKQAVTSLEQLFDDFETYQKPMHPSRELSTIKRMHSALLWAANQQTLNHQKV